MGKLCEFGVYNQNGIEHSLMCSKMNYNCGFIRFCTTEKCLKMLPKYKECRWRYKDMAKEIEKEEIIEKEELIVSKEETKETKEVKETPRQKKAVKINKKECLVLFVRNNKTFIKFDEDNSLEVKFKDGDKSDNLIELEYKGTFGSKDFEIV